MKGVAESTRLWGGRFESGPEPAMDRLNRSLPIDRRLWREDIAGSLAWATALGEARVLSREEEREIRAGLERVGSRLASWTEEQWLTAPDEDIHTLVERLLGEEVGEVAGKLHTGRSRNDQVATDTRLWSASAAAELEDQLVALQTALLEQAERHVGTLMPSYTHLQRAQPISAAHWLLSHVWPLFRDRERLSDAVGRLRALPLGSGAIAGCPYPVDRVLLKEVLGFREVSANSMDAVADRDFVAELLFTMALAGTHLSRLAEDVVLFASAEFGFVELPDGYSTGSSLMPQKRNPDGMELARGKSGRLIGDLVGWLVTLKGLPSGYNKDLQDDKEVLFSAFDTLSVTLPAVTGTIREMTLVPETCAAAVDSAMLATDVADALVAEGVPFRQAHDLVGRLVRVAEEIGCPLSAVPREAAVGIAPAFGRIDLDEALNARRSVERRSAAGGTAAAAIRDQLDDAWERL